MSTNHPATPSEHPRAIAPESVRAAIEHFAASRPDAEAVVMDGRTLTYAELCARSNRLADQLLLQGVGPEVPVGLLCERGLEAMVGMLAILAADGVCVPFDPSLPTERLRTMIALAGLRLVVTTEAMQRARTAVDGPVALVRVDGPTPRAPNLQSRLRPENTACIHFTAGPGGRPRAVPVSHAASENLIRWQRSSLPLEPGARVLQFSPPGLDSAWQEIASTLSSGGTLVLPPPDRLATPAALLELLIDAQVTRAYLPAATLAHLADASNTAARTLPHLRDVVAICGPVLVSHEIRAFFTAHPQCSLHAHYGHAETLVAFSHTVTGSPATWPSILPLGRPIRSVAPVLLDPVDQQPARGDTGELWIGGPYQARNYHRDPVATRERFRPDPFAPEGSTARIFRTGDHVRLAEDGVFELSRPGVPSNRTPTKGGRKTVLPSRLHDQNTRQPA
jgi:amino acid adenylation domain-containing protein